MLEKLGSILKKTTDKIANAILLDKTLVDGIIKDLQRALIEADVNVKLVLELSNKLKKIAGRSVTFLTNVSDEKIPEKFARAEAFIFPGIDDFGIVAVEALAGGTPVIAYKAGGALDYVDKTTGVFFNEQTPESLAKTIGEFGKQSFNHSKVAERAEKFSIKIFRIRIKELVKQVASGII